jgi:Fe-S-cluster containining protein
MSYAKTIKYLRKQIPSFKCKPGCTDCCGVIIFSRWEWEQIEDKRVATSLTCPYACKEGCEIYEQRPILCRLYGTVQGMKCPHGCGSDRMLPRKKEEEIMVKYNRIIAEG